MISTMVGTEFATSHAELALVIGHMVRHQTKIDQMFAQCDLHFFVQGIHGLQSGQLAGYI
jgi:hypothetical protein